MLPQYSQKSYSLYKFSSKHISGWCHKNFCTAPLLDGQEMHSQSIWRDICSISIFLFNPLLTIYDNLLCIKALII